MKLPALLLTLSIVFSGATAFAQSVTPVVRVAKFAGDRAAAISYTFDDGIRDQYTLAVPMLNEVGFKGTFFVIPGSVVKTVEEAERKKEEKRAWGSITWDELREMSAQGHEIGSHTWSHRGLAKLALAEVETEFTKATEAIKAQIGKPALTIAFPFNQSTPEIDAITPNYYIAYRSYQLGLGGEKSTLQSLNKWADQQVREGKWGVTMAHAIGHGYAAFTDPEIFRSHLHYVKDHESTIWVDTFANVARYTKERDDAKLVVTANTADTLTCMLTGSLDPSTYNVPLTVVMEISNATSAHAERAGHELPVRVASNTIQIDAVPAAAPITVNWH